MKEKLITQVRSRNVTFAGAALLEIEIPAGHRVYIDKVWADVDSAANSMSLRVTLDDNNIIFQQTKISLSNNINADFHGAYFGSCNLITLRAWTAASMAVRFGILYRIDKAN